MNLNFEHYKVFYYVPKYENLTKAASVLKTGQPAVTRTIHNLENDSNLSNLISLENGTIYKCVFRTGCSTRLISRVQLKAFHIQLRTQFS